MNGVYVVSPAVAHRRCLPLHDRAQPVPYGTARRARDRTYHESQSKPIYTCACEPTWKSERLPRGIARGYEGLPLVQGGVRHVVMVLSRLLVVTDRGRVRAVRAGTRGLGGSLPEPCDWAACSPGRRLLLVHGSESVDLRIAVERVPRREDPARSRVRNGRCARSPSATHPGISLTGSDLLPEHFGWLATVFPMRHSSRRTSARCPIGEEFDVVCALDVIEHLDEDDVALAEIARSVRPEGGVIVAVPQHMWLWGAWDEIHRHRRRYSRRSLLRMFDAAGLTPVRVTSSFSLVLPLVYVSRLRSRTIAEGGDPYRALRIPAAANHALGAVMRVERFAIRRGVSLPVGSSLTVVARKGR